MVDFALRAQDRNCDKEFDHHRAEVYMVVEVHHYNTVVELEHYIPEQQEQAVDILVEVVVVLLPKLAQEQYTLVEVERIPRRTPVEELDMAQVRATNIQPEIEGIDIPVEQVQGVDIPVEQLVHLNVLEQLVRHIRNLRMGLMRLVVVVQLADLEERCIQQVEADLGR
jgi:hypothetical protein